MPNLLILILRKGETQVLLYNIFKSSRIHCEGGIGIIAWCQLPIQSSLSDTVDLLPLLNSNSCINSSNDTGHRFCTCADAFVLVAGIMTSFL